MNKHSDNETLADLDTLLDDPTLSRDINLWMAVMDQAVKDYVTLEQYRLDPEISRDPDFIQEYESLTQWFQSSSMAHGSFNWICSVAQLDPEKTLTRLKLYKKVGLIPHTIAHMPMTRVITASM
jgi:hypothetical protein